MGIYDRDYYRQPQNRYGRTARWSFFSGKSVVFFLILINVILFLANGLLFPETNLLTGFLCMHHWTLAKPAFWFETLTYGFVQSPNDLMHILCNMIVLFFFGPPVERKYGGAEFLIFYLVAVIVGGLVWGILHFGPSDGAMLGASGAVSAVVILFSLNYPNVQVLLFGIIPMPAWVCGIGYVVYDAFGAMNGTGPIAHEVHLAGAAVALIYFFTRIRFTSLFYGIKRRFAADKKPKLKIWRVDESPQKDRLGEEVDQILRKISRDGESSLTNAERETLRRASREYQNRMKK